MSESTRIGVQLVADNFPDVLDRKGRDVARALEVAAFTAAIEALEGLTPGARSRVLGALAGYFS